MNVPAKIDESSIGIWLWVVLLILVNAEWIAMDLWLRRNGHEFLTVELREGLLGGGWTGLLLAAAIGATLGIALYHFGFQALSTR